MRKINDIAMQAHLFISGVVQGVGFRQFVKSNARSLGITGWVQNTEDGGVEIVLQGEKKVIEQMIAICKKGPMLSEIKQIGCEWEVVKEPCTDFVAI
jgi:acylphosphatase